MECKVIYVPVNIVSCIIILIIPQWNVKLTTPSDRDTFLAYFNNTTMECKSHAH